MPIASRLGHSLANWKQSEFREFHRGEVMNPPWQHWVKGPYTLLTEESRVLLAIDCGNSKHPVSDLEQIVVVSWVLGGCFRGGGGYLGIFGSKLWFGTLVAAENLITFVLGNNLT